MHYSTWWWIAIVFIIVGIILFIIGLAGWNRPKPPSWARGLVIAGIIIFIIGLILLLWMWAAGSNMSVRSTMF